MKGPEAKVPSLSHASTTGVGLADVCIRRPVFATMLNVLLVVVGWFAFRELGVEQIPNVELPIITVSTTLRLSIIPILPGRRKEHGAYAGPLG